MAYHGKTQLTFVIVAPPDQVAEGDRIFKSHAPWIEKTHHRNGVKWMEKCKVTAVPAANVFNALW